MIALFPALGFARDAREQARIEHLLDAVAKAEGVTFIRSGSEYLGAAAAEHLRRKLDYGGERLRTAEDFIKYCATESSLTHRHYKVRTSNGTLQDSAAYFTALLSEFDHPTKR